MDVKDAVRERKSIRKFRKDSVPEEIIREILETARWSPSWGNTQPWQIYVLTGDAAHALKEANRNNLLKGIPPSPDVPWPLEWPRELKKRYMDVGKNVLTALNIKRDDQESRLRYNEDMFYLFDAPCVVVITLDKAVTSQYVFIDVGLILQNICLLAQEKGLGTCIMACTVAYSDDLRAIAKIPENQMIVMGVIVGFPEVNAPINCFERQRANQAEFVTWVK